MKVLDEESACFTMNEVRSLLTSTADAPKRHVMTGQARALLYRVAVETGYRAGELRSLTRSSFDLDSVPPTVRLLAGCAKGKRRNTIQVRVGPAAMAKFPELSFLAGQAAKATGTDDAKGIRLQDQRGAAQTTARRRPQGRRASAQSGARDRDDQDVTHEDKASNGAGRPLDAAWERVDLNHRRLRRQIYSLIPLTTRAHSQRAISLRGEPSPVKWGSTRLTRHPG